MKPGRSIGAKRKYPREQIIKGIMLGRISSDIAKEIGCSKTLVNKIKRSLIKTGELHRMG